MQLRALRNGRKEEGERAGAFRADRAAEIDAERRAILGHDGVVPADAFRARNRGRAVVRDLNGQLERSAERRR